MNKPTHEEISQRAHKIWQDAGHSAGDARDHWLEAERQLITGASQPESHSPAAEHASSRPLSENESDRARGELAALQKKEAREPKLPHHTGPKPIPAETGKPLWDRPHSS